MAIIACSDDDEVSIPTDASGQPLTPITFVRNDGSEIYLLVEVADTPEERAVGLMGRESLPEDQGMLFVFEQEGQAGFWMKDTKIPLSIAFITAAGDIVDIQDMEPLSEELHVPDQAYLYAVEADQGWFARNGIDAQSTARIPAASSTP